MVPVSMLITQLMSTVQDGLDILFGVSILYLSWVIKSKLSAQDVRAMFQELFDHQEELINLKFELLRTTIEDLKEELRNKGR